MTSSTWVYAVFRQTVRGEIANALRRARTADGYGSGNRRCLGRRYLRPGSAWIGRREFDVSGFEVLGAVHRFLIFSAYQLCIHLRREPYWQGPVHVESAGRQRRTQNPISQQERLGTVHRAGGGTPAFVVEHLYERLQHHRDRQPEQQRSGRQRQCGCALLRYAARRIWDGVEGLHGPAQPVRASVGWGLLPVSVGWTDQEACPTSARSSRLACGPARRVHPRSEERREG